MRFSKPVICSFVLALGSPVLALPGAVEIRNAFELIDHDRDQHVSLLEWDQHAFALFRTADVNRDGSLDEVEIAEGPGKSGAVEQFDANRNGRLEIDEFMQLRRKLLVVADINGSDTVDRVEFEIFLLVSEAGWEDENGNGRMNLSELRTSLNKVFQLADADGDGTLSAAEAHFLTPVSYTAITSRGPLTPPRLYAHYRGQLTGE